MSRRIRSALPVATLLLAAWLLGVLVRIWAARWGHPFDLEWMEGGMLAHGWRLMQGLSLYPEPGPDFIPFVYPPGYSALLAGSGQVFGLGHALGRTWSLLGVGAAAAAAAWAIHRHTGQGEPAVLGAMVFLGAYPASGAFYDLVRPDGVAMGLLAWALVLGFERGRGATVAAGLLLAVAFTVKHHVAAFGLPILIGLWVRDGWRRAALFGACSALPAGLFTLGMQLLTEGRFLTYLVTVPASHPRLGGRVLPGLPRELGAALPFAVAFPALWALLQTDRFVARIPPALSAALPVGVGVAFAWLITSWWGFGPEGSRVGSALAAFGLASGALSGGLILGGQGIDALRRRGALDWRVVYVLGSLWMGLAVAALMRAHNGGYLNVYMHLHWMVALLFAGVVAAVGPGRWGPVAWGVAAAQLGWQLYLLDPAALSPTASDRRAGEAAIEILTETEGPVLSPWAAWLPVPAGHPPSLHYIALWDLDYPGGPYYDEVGRIRDALRQHYWSAVVAGSRPFGHGLQEHYLPRVELPVQGRALEPKTGWKVRPERVLEPKE